MQVGEVILERVLPDMIQHACSSLGVKVQRLSDDWVMRLERDDKIAWVFGYKFDINSSAAAAVAQDKVATFLALNNAGIAAVPHVLARSYAMQLISLSDVLSALPNDGPVVVKPLNGTGGRGIAYCEDVQVALTKIESDPEPAWAISPYLDLVSETRLILLDGEVLLAYEKRDPAYQDYLKLFNLARGAHAIDIMPDSRLQALATDTCHALSLRLAAVDVVQTVDGRRLVLEVNDGIKTESYARHSEGNARKAEEIYRTIISRMFS